MPKDKERTSPSDVVPADEAKKLRTRKAGDAVEKAIGSRLRAFYDEVAREPVPDRFVELLKRLDAKDSGKG